MPKALTSPEVAALKKDGTWRVDVGLYLQIRDQGATRSWLLRYRFRKRMRWMGLGPARLLTLTKAQRKAQDAQRLLLDGIDPIEARRADRGAVGMTFADATEKYIAAHKGSWTSAQHHYQWRQSLEAHAYPVIGKLAVDLIDANHIVKLLEPIWATKSETAGKVRSRIERVLDWAENAGHRTGTNPAKWRGGLEHRLPALSRVQTITHHVAIPWQDAPAVYARLAANERTSSRALRFVALTAVRAGEALGATWAEVDFETKTWTVPAGRAKSRRPHRVPLSPAAIDILMAMRGDRESPTGLVFPGAIKGKMVSDQTLRKLLRTVGPADADTHGWRSTFRDWSAEKTSFPREVAEAALAHVLGDKVEVAYLRTDLFERRVELMDAWATFLAK